MTDSSRTQGALICGGAGFAALPFLIGLLRSQLSRPRHPVAALTLFVLGLAFWVGWTIATIRVRRARTRSRAGERHQPARPARS